MADSLTSKQMSDQQRRKVFAEHLQAAVSALDMRNAYQGPMAPDRAILTSLMEYLEKSPPECPYCHGNDRDAPCAYPSEGKPGCLRDERLAVETSDVENLRNAVTAMRSTRDEMQRRLIEQDGEIEKLRADLAEAKAAFNLMCKIHTPSPEEPSRCTDCGVMLVPQARHFSGCKSHPGEPAVKAK